MTASGSSAAAAAMAAMPNRRAYSSNWVMGLELWEKEGMQAIVASSTMAGQCRDVSACSPKQATQPLVPIHQPANDANTHLAALPPSRKQVKGQSRGLQVARTQPIHL